MIQTSAPVEKAKEKAEELIEEVAEHPWTERIARFGYAAKGVVYIVVGALATLFAFGVGGKATDARGAMHTIARQPFGEIMLGVVALGLVGYVLWRWVQAVADADGKGRDAKGLSIRTGYFFSGLVYAGLAASAVQIILHARREGSSDAARQDWTARLMSLPYGRWMVGLVGVGIIGFGLYQIYKGYKAKFRKRLKLGEMGDAKHTWATLAGRAGYAARGIVFCVAGVFLVQAARDFDPTEVRGLDGALMALTQQSFGPWILALVALGLVAYGCYMLVEARYRVIGGS